MIRFNGAARLETIATIGGILAMTTALALAGDSTVSSDQILNALQPKSPTRAMLTNPAAKAKELQFIETLRSRETRALSLGERDEIAQIASSRPRIDLEIQFDYNSADIRKSSIPAVRELGKALSTAELKNSAFVLAGHTDAIGGETFNQALSERRADTIKRYLVENYGISGNDLITVGYGKSRLKAPGAPTDSVNRRVEVVNMETKPVK